MGKLKSKCNSCFSFPETYSELSKTSSMELFEKIVKSWKPLTIFAKTSILDIWQDSDYASDFSLLNLILNSFSSTWDFMAYTLTLNITTSLLYGCSFYVLVLVLFITIFFTIYSSLIIRQKSESQNGCFKKTKQAKFSEKRPFLLMIRTRTRAYQGVRNVRFSEIWCALFSWNIRFEIRLFCLITDEFRNKY